MVHERPCQNKNAIIHLVIWRGNYIIVKGKYHYKITTKLGTENCEPSRQALFDRISQKRSRNQNGMHWLYSDKVINECFLLQYL